MPAPEMNQFQLAAFWVWYKSDMTSVRHERSFKATAKRLKCDERTVKTWHDEFDWDKRAMETGYELNRELDARAKANIIDTFEDAVGRQREIAAALFAKFKAAIDAGQLELKVADLVKLMEFETNYIYGEQRGTQQGNLLAIILGAMAPEKRAEFYATVERTRDAGVLRGPRMESARRN